MFSSSAWNDILSQGKWVIDVGHRGESVSTSYISLKACAMVNIEVSKVHLQSYVLGRERPLELIKIGKGRDIPDKFTYYATREFTRVHESLIDLIAVIGPWI
jgi:hypothetical protein